MKRHVLILGSGGMLGHVVNLYLRSQTEFYLVTDVARNSNILCPDFVLDLVDFDALNKLIEVESPDVIINCVGILNGNSLNSPADTILINSYLPHFLEKITSGSKCRVVHISTDCVFSGKNGAYKENDIRDADDIYGKSKALGEIINSHDLTLRTSIIGPELKENGVGLFHWFMHQSGEINGYTHAIWSGVTTLELAKVIHETIQQNLVGLAHVTNGEKISKFDLLLLLKEVWKKNDICINAFADYFVDKSLSPSKLLKYQVPSYKKMLEDQWSWMEANPSLYKHFYKV